MANFLKPDKAKLLRDALESGASVRQAAQIAGCSKVTASAYRVRWAVKAICGCGQDSTHNGWCWWRYRQSEARQAFVSTWNRGAGWPFVVAHHGSDLVATIHAAVPKELPEDVRAEVCQDLCVAILEGSLRAEDTKSRLREFINAVYRRYPNRWGPLSLTSPFRDGGYLTPLDVIEAEPMFDLGEEVEFGE